jgi:hypothetical protein
VAQASNPTRHGERPSKNRITWPRRELLSDDDPFLCVDAVNLKNVLGDIPTDRGNLHVDGSLV